MLTLPSSYGVHKFPIHTFLHNYYILVGDRVHANAKHRWTN